LAGATWILLEGKTIARWIGLVAVAAKSEKIIAIRCIILKLLWSLA
jgi:hypothetical protein